jgi:hypothetical protein
LKRGAVNCAASPIFPMSDLSFVIVHTASSFQEARILAGFLESEGITSRVPGANLADEFGMSQKLAGTADVAVLAKDIEKAQDIVAAWIERGTEGASEGAGEEPSEANGD